jgi:hypothetical protein
MRSVTAVMQHDSQKQLYFKILSIYRVIIEGAWIGNWIYWTFTDPWLQVIINVSSVKTLYTVCYSTYLSVLSLLYLHQSLPGDGFQRRIFPFAWVHELYPWFSYQVLIETAQQLNHISPLTNPLTNSLTNRLTPLHSTPLHWLTDRLTDWLNNSLLTDCPIYNISAWTAQKTPFLCCCLRAVA